MKICKISLKRFISRKAKSCIHCFTVMYPWVTMKSFWLDWSLFRIFIKRSFRKRKMTSLVSFYQRIHRNQFISCGFSSLVYRLSNLIISWTLAPRWICPVWLCIKDAVFNKYLIFGSTEIQIRMFTLPRWSTKIIIISGCTKKVYNISTCR